MSRKQLIEMTRRNIAHAKAGTQDQAPGIFRVPATNYYDPERWQREMDGIFKRLPLMLGFSSEISKPGDYRAMEVAGVPVLMARADDGEIRAFVNMCTHRGAVIVAEGVGNSRRIVCPYHAWAFDQKGSLVGILDNDEFGDLDKSCNGLTQLPCTERAGLIWVTLAPEEAVDIDSFLRGYDEMLAHLGLADCHVVGRQQLDGPNWKIAYDGYLDIYHIPILHRETFGNAIPNKAVYDAWGPHQKVSIPMPGIAGMEEMPEEDWPIETMTAGVWTIFPHISIALFDAGGPLYMVSQLFPGDNADESVTVQNFLAPVENPDEEHQEKIKEQMKFLRHVVGDEDYLTGNKIQRSIKTGNLKDVLFGQNEGGGQRFHSWVDALIAADDAELPKVFESKIGPPVK